MLKSYVPSDVALPSGKNCAPLGALFQSIALASVTGIGGGAIAVQYFRLQEWVDSVTGLVALGGLIFGCGLPGWAIVRWVFNFIDKNRGARIDEIAKEVKEVL